MARQKSGKAKQKARKSNPTAKAQQPLTRRDQMIRWATYGVGAAVIVAAIGWGVTSVQADLYEQDLSRLGRGTPAIVQVHDPNCAPCIDLERETRAALKDFDDADLTYLVASLPTTAGQVFASQYGASYATLLFFDEDGGLVQRLRGPSHRDALKQLFQAHIDTQP